MTPSSPSPVPGPAAGPEAPRELLYERALDWLADDPDPRTRSEVADLIEAADDDQLADRFSCLVPFGTAGLRAELGAGPNRMNLAVVIRAAAAVAGWVHRREGRASHGGQPSVVVGFDARHRSQEFAVAAAEVLAGAGVRALLLPGPVPTPLTAFAVTHLGADAALMVTASHNPSGDNGLKVFDASGRQIVSPQDREIADDMTAIARVSSVPRTGPDDPDIVHLDATVQQAYLAAAAMMVKTDGPRDLVVAYTPLHGVAGDLFGRLVESAGFSPVAVVADQAAPDPDFPTVAFPNPEEPGTLERALTLAERCGADILLAPDPDGDRLGVAIPDDGWRVLTGDEIGVMIARHLLAVGQMRDGAVMASSVVSSRLLAAVAAAAGVEHVTTLTGFKWISRAPGPGQYLAFGYEEALGYCVHGPTADKDGLTAALMLMESAADLRAHERSLADALDDLAVAHGLHRNVQRSVRLSGLQGRQRLASMMQTLRQSPPRTIGGRPVTGVADLLHGDPVANLAPSDLLIFHVEGGRVVVRPSGTESKLKVYVEVVLAVPDRASLPELNRQAEVEATELTDDVVGLLESLSIPSSTDPHR